MGTEVLRPQDCLIRPAPSLFPRRKPNPNYHHPRSCRKPTTPPRPEPKKRREGSPKPAKWGAAAAGSGLVMGQVTILKRGQSLDSGMARKRAEAGQQEVGGCRDLELFGTGRLGPDPSMIPKQIRVANLGLLAGGRQHDVYAGTAFEQSPSPRALPLPRFAARPAVAAVNSSATEDLRRLLRLG